MARINAFIKVHPVLSYFALVFAISWGGLLVIIGGPSHIPGTAEETTSLFAAMYVVTIAGPSLAGIVLTAVIGGRAGLRELRSRLFKWRVGARWYAVALLTAPLSVMATLLVLSLVSPAFVPGIFSNSVEASLLRFGALAGAGLVTALAEEIGWTGFAIPRLTPRYGVLTTGIFVGFLWGAWHFLSNVWGPEPTGGLSLALFMPVILFTFLPPFRVLMVWVYDRTGSLLVAVLMHASLIAFWQLFWPDGIEGVPLITWDLVWGAALWVVVAAVAIANGWRFTRHAGLRTAPHVMGAS